VPQVQPAARSCLRMYYLNDYNVYQKLISDWWSC